jgi:hypothetical protein
LKEFRKENAVIIALAVAVVVAGLTAAIFARTRPNNTVRLNRLGARLVLGGAILFGLAFPAIL